MAAVDIPGDGGRSRNPDSWLDLVGIDGEEHRLMKDYSHDMKNKTR